MLFFELAKIMVMDRNWNFKVVSYYPSRRTNPAVLYKREGRTTCIHRLATPPRVENSTRLFISSQNTHVLKYIMVQDAYT